MEFNETPIANTVDPIDPKSKEEVLAVLSDAKAKLTEGGIQAVIAIRRYATLYSSLEELILNGEVDAVRSPDVQDTAPLSVDDFEFWYIPEDEQRDRCKPHMRRIK